MFSRSSERLVDARGSSAVSTVQIGNNHFFETILFSCRKQVTLYQKLCFPDIKRTSFCRPVFHNYSGEICKNKYVGEETKLPSDPFMSL
jgi:hypothetical protein